MMIRRWVFCLLLAPSLFIQACDKGGGDGAPPASSTVAPQASVNAALLEKADTAPNVQAGKALPPSHPPVDASANAPLPNNPLEALHILKTRVDQNPQDLQALISFANANMMVERYQVAAELYTRALAINPKDLDVRTNLAIAYKYVPKVDLAIAELKKNLEKDPRHNASLYNLGFIYAFDKRDFKAATELWKKWLELYPNAEGAEQVKEYLVQMESLPASPPDASASSP